MKVKNVFLPLLVAWVLELPMCVSASEAISRPIEITASAVSIYWATLATDVSRPLTCAWPARAQTAELRVTGCAVNLTQTFTRGAGDAWLEIPAPQIAAPSRFEDEGLLTLTLAFDVGVSLTGRVASVRGARDFGTRVIPSTNGNERAWRKVSSHALIPIPTAGAESAFLNDKEVAIRSTGNCGWYEWSDIPLGINTFAVNGQTASLFRVQDGSFL